MAYTSKKTQYWLNNDGLLQWYFTDQAKPAKAGILEDGNSGRQVLDMIVRLTDLPTVASANVQIQEDTVVIPKGVQIEEVQIEVLKVTAGAGSTLSVGLVNSDRTTTIDDAGILSASTTTWHTGVIGKTVVYRAGDTQAGTLVGTVTTAKGLVTAKANTADFTAGVVRVRVFFVATLAADYA